MDKKNILLGILFLVGAFGLMFYAQRQEDERLREWREQQERIREQAPAETPAEDAAPSVADPVDNLASPTAPDIPETPEELITLENDFLAATFTTRGGAIKEVALKNFAETKGSKEPYVFNERAPTPALELAEFRPDRQPRPLAYGYEVVRRSEVEITFRAVTTTGLEITRTYTLPGNGNADGATPYLIETTTEIATTGETPVAVDRLLLSLGTAAPVEGDPHGWFLNVGHYDGEDTRYHDVGDFRGGSGFLGIGASEPRPVILDQGSMYWGSVKNQFFTAILTPSQPASGLRSSSVRIPTEEDVEVLPLGVTGSLVFDGGVVRPGESREISALYYVGPKELNRLNELGETQGEIMQYPPVIGGLSRLFLWALKGIHGFVANYGVAIVVLTIIIRLLFFPLTAAGAKNARLMQTRLSEPMKALNEKFQEKLDKAKNLEQKQKINQQKQKEMMELYKTAGVNPLAGCLPLLIQMPVFLGFFYMLRAAAELRFEGFLWISDLSQPDTIATIAGIPINPMPLIMTASIVVQMRVASPPTMDKTQKMIMQFMPIMMLVFLYNFSSGLALYWTTSNIFTIFQQLVINRQLDQHPETARPKPDTDPKAAHIATTKKSAGKAGPRR